MKTRAVQLLVEGLALLGVFLAPIHGLMLAVGALVMADFGAGIWASVKRGQRVTSRRMRETVSKSIAYQAAIIVGFILDGLIGTTDVFIARVIAALIGLVEAKSVFESLTAITGLDFWAVIMEKIKPTLNDAKEVEVLEEAAPVPAPVVTTTTITTSSPVDATPPTTTVTTTAK